MNRSAAAALAGRFALGLAMFAGVLAPARAASFTVCGDAGERLRFEVTFNASFESAVTITDLSAKQDVMTFNNHFGRGAGPEWRMGAGTWVTPELAERTCYAVKGVKKAGPADPALPWQDSRAAALAPERWAFDDGVDGDFDDAVVAVTRLEERRVLGISAGARGREGAATAPGARGEVEAQRRRAPAPPVAAAMREPVPPQFAPWPPPQASGREIIPMELVTGKGKSATWGAVADRFEGALGRAGYRDLSHYAVPNGFAITTRVERIELGGEPAAEPARWVISEAALSASTWTLEGLLRRLAGAPLGHSSLAFDMIDWLSLEASQPYLAPVQGLAATALSAFFVQKDADERRDRRSTDRISAAAPAGPVAGGG